MTPSLNNILMFVFVAGFLYGIRLMNSPSTAVRGNLLGGFCMLGAVAAVLLEQGILGQGILWLSMGAGGIIGYLLAMKAAMIQIPQLVALLNGLGGGASAVTAFAILGFTGNITYGTGLTGGLALIVGSVTFSGSMIAAAKLDRKINQKPVVITGHTAVGYGLVAIMAVLLVILTLSSQAGPILWLSLMIIATALAFGVMFTLRIGGADMPVTISLLNSLSGLAGSIAGFAVRNPLLVAVGAIVGAAGLILTRVMCRAMNRSLREILLGKTTMAHRDTAPEPTVAATVETPRTQAISDIDILRNARRIIIVPGYGMALSQAQTAVKTLYDRLADAGKDVWFAIHPVAGRMPGHMNVLLAEVDVPYDRLLEMDDANPMFGETDAVIVVGANDVVNTAATTAENTPIYGMPILNVAEAGRIIVFNLDRKPGYAGVDNPLYDMENVSLRLGDAAATLGELIDTFGN